MIVQNISSLGYLSLVILGMFFVSTFTVTPTVMILFRLTYQFDPLVVACLASVGAVLGDLIIFHFLRDQVYEELKPLFAKIHWHQASHIFKSRYIAWTTPVLGAIIIASPLPDELGVALMSGSHLKRWQFVLLSYILNSVGIFIIIELVRL